MAMTQKERDQRRQEKADRRQEHDLRLKVMPSTRQALESLMDWRDIEEQGEALTLLIHNVQGKGDLSVRRMTRAALHRIIDTTSVERPELRLKAMPGTIAALDALKDWLGVECYGSVVSIIVETAFIAGPPKASLLLMPPPRKPYVIPAAIARRLESGDKRKALTASHS